MRAAGEALVHMSTRDDLTTDLPRRFVSKGALISIVWLVIHHEPHPAYKTLVADSLQV